MLLKFEWGGDGDTENGIILKGRLCKMLMKFDMKPVDELRHLLYSSNPEDRVEWAGLVIFKIHCQGNADRVLQNCQEALSVVLKQYEKDWPSEEEWYNLLPKWFVERCGPERSEEEEDEDIARWRTLSPEEQLQEIEQEKWSVMDWISWFDLSIEPRYWFWWNAIIQDSNTLFIALQVVDDPIPYGSFSWLLRASGAIMIQETSDEMLTELGVNL